MPIVKIPISNVTDSFTRPVVKSITTQLNTIMGLDENLPIYYPEEDGTLAQYKSDMNQDGDMTHGSAISKGNFIQIDVSEAYDPMTAIAPEHNREFFPIFNDDTIQIMAKPIYLPFLMHINYRYQFKDKAAVGTWYNHMRAKMVVNGYGDMNAHELSYHYLIPEEFFAVMAEIYKLKTDSTTLEDKGFWDYMKKHFSPRLTRMSNADGTNTRLGIAEHQVRCYGMYDLNVESISGDKDSNAPNYTATFTYNVRYSRPVEFLFEYPLMIRQKLIPAPFVPSAKDTMYQDAVGEERHFSLSGINFELFSAKTQRIWNSRAKGISIPDFDEFVPHHKPRGTQRIYDILLSLDKPDANQELFNIADITGESEDGKELQLVYFSDRMKEFMKGEVPYLTQRASSVFHFQMFNQWALLNNKYYHIDENLNLVNTLDLDLDNVYHGRLNLYQKWSEVDPMGLERLSYYPDVVRDLVIYLGFNWQVVVKWICEHKAKFKDIDILSNCEDYWWYWIKIGKIPGYWMDIIVRIISGLGFSELGPMRTVETLYVESYRNGIDYYRSK